MTFLQNILYIFRHFFSTMNYCWAKEFFWRLHLNQPYKLALDVLAVFEPSRAIKILIYHDFINLQKKTYLRIEII